MSDSFGSALELGWHNLRPLDAEGYQLRLRGNAVKITRIVMIAERTCTVSNMGRTRPSDWSATKPASCNATKSPQTDRAKYAKRGDNATATPIRPRTSPMTPSLVRWATEVSDCGFQKGVAPKIHGSAMMAWRLPMKNMAGSPRSTGLTQEIYAINDYVFSAIGR